MLHSKANHAELYTMRIAAPLSSLGTRGVPSLDTSAIFLTPELLLFGELSQFKASLIGDYCRRYGIWSPMVVYWHNFYCCNFNCPWIYFYSYWRSCVSFQHQSEGSGLIQKACRKNLKNKSKSFTAASCICTSAVGTEQFENCDADKICTLGYRGYCNVSKTRIKVPFIF